MGERSAANPIRMYSRRFVTIDMVAGDYSLITLAEVNVYLLALYSLRFLPFTFFFSALKSEQSFSFVPLAILSMCQEFTLLSFPSRRALESNHFSMLKAMYSESK
jgi:hypothetical protein